MLVVIGVISMFAVFAVSLLWADWQTKDVNPVKRRPF